MHESSTRTPAQIGAEWDKVAQERFFQITEGRDKSYIYTLCPFFEKRAASEPFPSVLDVGCGVGFLTDRLAAPGRRVLGVDLSKKSVEIARQHFAQPEFVVGDIVDTHVGRFDLVVANMVLMDYPYLRPLLRKISSLLSDGGCFLATIPNPYVWPRYWGYEGRKWFSYQREVGVETEFRVSSAGGVRGLTTHFHRPLSDYLREGLDAGLVLKRFVELTGADIPHRFLKKYPRFLAFEFTK